MSPVFRHGRLRLYLLKLLDEAPRHGYEVIRLLQDRFLGVYAPSPGTIYPRLARRSTVAAASGLRSANSRSRSASHSSVTCSPPRLSASSSMPRSVKYTLAVLAQGLLDELRMLGGVRLGRPGGRR